MVNITLELAVGVVKKDLNWISYILSNLSALQTMINKTIRNHARAPG